MISLLSLGDRSTAIQNSQCRRAMRRFVGQMAFQSSPQLQLTAYLCARPLRPRFVTSIEGKLGTGLGIPQIVTITNTRSKL